MHKLDSTTTSMQSAGGLTFHSQYRNVRTYSNLYPNPSKGFSLPSINMKNSSIFYEKQRLGVGSGLKIGQHSSPSKFRFSDALGPVPVHHEVRPLYQVADPIMEDPPSYRQGAAQLIHNPKTKTIVQKEDCKNREMPLSSTQHSQRTDQHRDHSLTSEGRILGYF